MGREREGQECEAGGGQRQRRRAVSHSSSLRGFLGTELRVNHYMPRLSIRVIQARCVILLTTTGTCGSVSKNRLAEKLEPRQRFKKQTGRD